MENIRLNSTKARAGWVASLASLNMALDRSKGRSSQSGVPKISSGGATRVSNTCCNMWALNR